MTLPRLDWPYVLQEAAKIVNSYDTPVTLRQLFYRLVSREIIENTQSRYNALSSRTAQARREGWFPGLLDNVREFYGFAGFTDPDQAIEQARRWYSRDHSEYQDYTVVVAVEKNALRTQLSSWFSDFDCGVAALGGYASQTYVDQVVAEVERDGKESVLIYGGDFDPSGEDLYRDFLERTDCWQNIVKIALNWEQIEEYDLPPLPGKASDSRAAAFEAKHGQLVQVELDALPPDTLRDLYMDEFNRWWDYEAWERSKDQEKEERKQIQALPAGSLAVTRKEVQGLRQWDTANEVVADLETWFDQNGDS